ncbi:MAG: [ribosomal protein S18]-alanine N-acetyltransferase [Synergistaceae bacterium]|jgi:ribosomal-protein-alanine N-acetyltransferase|nr:MAG: Ribosomal-protein-alanine acetyltransferase [Synergistales bacterium 54_24]MDI3533526.1 [ribosomal protein S18]-alanine N-acetyltransferase [Synergistaceae bacterium]
MICGFSAFSRKRRTLRVMNLAVLPEYRRQGVASQLLLAMEEMAKLWGCKEMALEVRESNYGAQALYARFGFYKARRLGRYYSDGEAAFLMKARLPLRVHIQKNPT